MYRKKLFIVVSIVFLVTGCGSTQESDETTQTLQGEVLWVADGDTFTMEDHNTNYKIRLLCIDTPESDQPYGDIAKEALVQKVDGKIVEVDYTDYDFYDRVLGFVYTNEEVNLAMVRSGHAWVYRYDCTQCEYYDAELYARENNLGIWSTQNPVPPWEWRKSGEDAENTDWSYLYDELLEKQCSTQ